LLQGSTNSTTPTTYVIGENGHSTTFAGTIADGTAPNAVNLTKAGSGTQTLSGSLAYSGTTAVNGGTLRLATNLAKSSGVAVTDGGILQLAPGGSRVIVTTSVTATGGGAVDLTNNQIVVTTPGAAGGWNGSAYDGLTGLVASGRNGGGGIVSSSIAPGDRLHAIGVAKAGDVKGIADGDTATFAGQTVHGSDTLVMYTYGGDANLDGKINIDDYGRIDSNVGQNGTVFGWYNGDFNYDGNINIDDYGIIDANIGVQGAPLAAAQQPITGVTGAPLVAVPEPAIVGIAPLALLAARGRRQRRRRQQRCRS
jgi:autotransporter-associated beta strand protein